MINLRAPSPAWATAMIAAAEQAGEDGDRDLHFALLWLVATRAHWADPGPAARRTLVEAASRLGDADDLHVLAIQAYADPFGHAPAVLAHVQKAAAEGANDTEALLYLGNAAVAVGAFDVADTLLSAGTRALRADGRLGHLAYVLSVQGIVTTRLAKWDVAIPAAEEASRLSIELGQPLWKAAADTIVSAIAGMRGDEDAAEQASAEAERIALPIGANMIVAMAQFGRVSAALGASRHDDAYEAAERLFDPTGPAHHPAMASWIIGDLAEAALHAGRVEEARARVAQIETVAGNNPTIWIALGLRHARAVLADDERAAERFDEALGADLGRWPFQRARALLAHGRWLRRQRRITARAQPCARRATRSTRSAAPRSANRPAASCAPQGSRADGATPPPATSSRRRNSRSPTSPPKASPTARSANTLPLPPHDRHAPLPHLPEARNHRPRRARRRPVDRRRATARMTRQGDRRGVALRARLRATTGADMSPLRSPCPFKRRCRAKALRNHNPRVGGSSPSSGMTVLGGFRLVCRRFARIQERGVRPQRTAANRPWLTVVTNRVSNSGPALPSGARRAGAPAARWRERVGAFPSESTTAAAVEIGVEPLGRVGLLGLREELGVALDHLQV